MNRKQKAAAEKAAAEKAEKAVFVIVNMTDELADEVEFENSLQANMISSSALTNKKLVQIDKRTFFNSKYNRDENNMITTETAFLDLAITAFLARSEKCTLQMICKHLAFEYKLQVTRARLAKHIFDNKAHRLYTTVLANDVVKFADEIKQVELKALTADELKKNAVKYDKDFKA